MAKKILTRFATIVVLIASTKGQAATNENAAWESTRAGFMKQCGQAMQQGGRNTSKQWTRGEWDGTLSDMASDLARQACPCTFELAKKNMSYSEWRQVYPLDDRTHPEGRIALRKLMIYFGACTENYQ